MNSWQAGNTSGDITETSVSEPTADSHTHALAAAAVNQSKLKTSSGSVEVQESVAENVILPGGEYGFYPQVKMETTSFTFDVSIAMGLKIASYITNVYVYNHATSAGHDAWVRQRYVTASGEIHWIFILRDKATKKKRLTWEAPDHPCFGNGGNPDKIRHPFLNYDSEKQEIIVVNPTKEEVTRIKRKQYADESSFQEAMLELFDLNETKIAEWPTIPVTVGLPYDVDLIPGEKVVPIKKIIPQPGFITARCLIEKASKP